MDYICYTQHVSFQSPFNTMQYIYHAYNCCVVSFHILLELYYISLYILIYFILPLLTPVHIWLGLKNAFRIAVMRARDDHNLATNCSNAPATLMSTVTETVVRYSSRAHDVFLFYNIMFSAALLLCL